MIKQQVAETELIFTLGVVGRVLHMLSSNVNYEIKTLSPNEDLEEDVQKAKRIISHILLALRHDYNNFGEMPCLISSIFHLKRIVYEIEHILDMAATKHLEGRRIDERSIELCSKLRWTLTGMKQMSDKYMGRMPAKARYIPPVLLSNSSNGSSHSEWLLSSWEDEIIGRESEKQQIAKWIFQPSNQQQNPNVISITGDSGIGKTSVAKLIYNDALVSTSFDLLLWASLISACYLPTLENLRILIVEMIRSFTQQSWLYLHGMDMETLKHKLCDILKGRKYLLVLDDFTYLCSEEWESLRKLLSLGSMGSTIIFTTSYRGYKMVGRANILELKGLPETASWLLYSRYCKFDEEGEQEYPFLRRFDSFKKDIVQRCNGNPLLIKTLASMSRTNGDIHKLKHKPEREIWTKTLEDSTIILSDCLRSMPLELVQCFYACVILSKHKALSRDQLVYFWMAQGLLYSMEGNYEDHRDIGHRYYNELLSRSFIQSYQSDGHNRLFVNYAFQQLYSTGIEENGRYIIWHRGTDLLDREFGSSYNPHSVKTFLLHGWVGPVEKLSLERLVIHLRHVRVLLLDGTLFEELPESIGDLDLLRYLSLAGNLSLKTLSETICKLANLQTLDLSGCNFYFTHMYEY